jgi:hypothetical protein
MANFLSIVLSLGSPKYVKIISMKYIKAFTFLLFACCALVITACVDRGQYVDLKADVSVQKPFYQSDHGPNIVIDAAHANFHTVTGRYEPLANMLRNDGFSISENQSVLTDSSFAATDIFVISNAGIDPDGATFTTEEISALRRFVSNGGSLLLIADHTPFPGAIIPLAEAFSIHFYDVYADDGESGLFTKNNGGLTDDKLLQDINKVRTFGGSAFRIENPNKRPLLVMNDQWTMQRMEANGLSAKETAKGLLQGAVMDIGKGKIAVFGEAAMFSAQRYGRDKKRMGFHARGAEDNQRFILNVFHWLGE